jgi:Leucine rich repeat
MNLIAELTSKTLPNGKPITKKLLTDVLFIMNQPKPYLQVVLANNDDGSLLHALYYVQASLEIIQQFARCYSSNKAFDAIAADTVTDDVMRKTLVTFKSMAKEAAPLPMASELSGQLSNRSIESLYGFNEGLHQYQWVSCIDFSYNHLSQSFFRVFSSCENLKILDLSSNLITEISDDEWWALPASLEVLKLWGNQIKKFPHEAWFVQKKLDIFLEDAFNPSISLFPRAPTAREMVVPQVMKSHASHVPARVMTNDISEDTCTSILFFGPFSLGFAIPAELAGEGILGCICIGGNAAVCTSPIGHGIIAAISCAIGMAGAYKVLFLGGCDDDPCGNDDWDGGPGG